MVIDGPSGPPDAGDEPPDRQRSAEWQDLLSRGEVDRCGRGVIDERGKRFSPAERRIAEYLGPVRRVAIPTSESALSRFMSAATSLTMMTSPGRRVRTSLCRASTRP
jgi:hypothetical protein